MNKEHYKQYGLYGQYWVETQKVKFQSHPQIKGYILLQEYPGCDKKVGDFEFYTDELSKYPNIWKPIYHKEYLREMKINQILSEN